MPTSLKKQPAWGLLACLIALTFLHEAPAHAGTVQITALTARDDLMAVKERLVSSFKFNLAGAQRYAAWRTLKATREEFEPFAQEFSGATIAHMEYRWTNAAGLSRTSVYHAMSGRTPPALLASRYETGVPQYSWPDWHTYLNDTAPDVYAHIPDGERSILQKALRDDVRPGIGRAYDAEMRAVRTIERDILANNLTRGGTVVAWTSMPPCPACRRALETFASEYDVDIKLFHLPPQEQFTSNAFRLTQMTKNRMTRNFAQRVENYRQSVRQPGRVACERW